MTTTGCSFSEVKKGMRAKVVSISDDTPELKRLIEMGLTIGTEFRVIKVAPFGDPVEIELRGYRLCMRKVEAGGIRIEVLEDVA